jgi:hypothetical protein
MSEFAPYLLEADLTDSHGKLERVTIRIDPPTATDDDWFVCAIHGSMFDHGPYRSASALAHDAWARAFEWLHSWLQWNEKRLVAADGTPVILPSPPRDTSWETPSPPPPDVTGVAPIFRAEGWVTKSCPSRQRVELAIWPAVEEEANLFCAPTLCTFFFDGKVKCIYGVSVEQAVFHAYQQMRVAAEHYAIVDDDGQAISVPMPPEPSFSLDV